MAMTEDEIEMVAWKLETKMMEIRRDPRAALTAGLAKIRATMLADWEKRLAAKDAKMAEAEAKLETELEKRVAELDALFAAKLEKRVAKLDAMFAAGEVKAKAELAALMSGIRAAHAGLRAGDEEAEPPQPLQ